MGGGRRWDVAVRAVVALVPSFGRFRFAEGGDGVGRSSWGMLRVDCAIVVWQRRARLSPAMLDYLISSIRLAVKFDVATMSHPRCE